MMCWIVSISQVITEMSGHNLSFGLQTTQCSQILSKRRLYDDGTPVLSNENFEQILYCCISEVALRFESLHGGRETL